MLPRRRSVRSSVASPHAESMCNLNLSILWLPHKGFTRTRKVLTVDAHPPYPCSHACGRPISGFSGQIWLYRCDSWVREGRGSWQPADLCSYLLGALAYLRICQLPKIQLQPGRWGRGTGDLCYSQTLPPSLISHTKLHTPLFWILPILNEEHEEHEVDLKVSEDGSGEGTQDIGHLERRSFSCYLCSHRSPRLCVINSRFQGWVPYNETRSSPNESDSI